MADLLLPLHLRQAQTSFRYIDATGISRGMFTGALKTAARGGDRWGATIQFTKHGGNSAAERSNRAAMRAFIAGLRGRQSRVYLTDLSYRRRGSMPTGELLLNNTFANGSTGYSTSNQNTSIAAADRVLRSTRANVLGGTAIRHDASRTAVPFAPYALRAHVVAGRGAVSWALRLGTTNGAADIGQGPTQTAGGLGTFAAVPAGSTFFASILDSSSGKRAYDYMGVSYMSLSRCALVDGGVNLLLRSDQLDNAAWTKTRTSISGNTGVTTAPDGTATADAIIEDTSAGTTHFVSQTVAVAADALDYSFGVALKPGSRTWAQISMVESIGGSEAAAYINLSTGAVGSVGAGSNWANPRAMAPRALGNGWYHVAITARKTNAATAVTPRIYLATGDGGASYTGVSNEFYAWRANLSQSSVPAQLSQSVDVAVAATLAGNGVETKGWPASTSGLLLVGDQIEIITSRGSEPKILTAPVDSDAAGLAHVQFEPPLRGTPADNAPIIVHQPMGRFVYASESPGWDNEPGFWSSASCDFEEACV